MQFEIEFNDDIHPDEDFIKTLVDVKQASFVVPSEEIDIEQSLIMDLVIKPLRNLIEEKKILPGKYQVYGLSPNNRTMLFNAMLRSFNEKSKSIIKSQVILTYDLKNESRHRMIGKIRVLYIGRTYTYEIYTLNPV